MVEGAHVRAIRRALEQRRYFNALPATLDFDTAYDIARSRIKVGQQKEEIRWLYERVRELSPETVLEVGIGTGGTLFLWTRASAKDAFILAVDNFPEGRLGRFSAFPLVRRAFGLADQRVELLLGVDSHDPMTIARIRELIGSRPVDFLFIDGDHTYEGVWADVRAFGPMVRPGGVVAFHDISAHATEWTEGVARFWQEFSSWRAVEERVVDAEPGYGVGLYTVVSNESWDFGAPLKG